MATSIINRRTKLLGNYCRSYIKKLQNVPVSDWFYDKRINNSHKVLFLVVDSILKVKQKIK